MTVGATSIGGTLKYISDYSSAGYTGDELSGNFLVIHSEVPNLEGVTIKVKVIGGNHGASTLDADGLCICRIKNTNQKIQVVASKDGYDSVAKVFTLSGLTLLSE